MPFSFGTIPENMKDYTFGNNFIALPMYLALEDDFETACRKVHK